MTVVSLWQVSTRTFRGSIHSRAPNERESKVEKLVSCLAFNWSYQITACAVAISCCISDVSSEWEGAIFDPP